MIRCLTKISIAFINIVWIYGITYFNKPPNLSFIFEKIIFITGKQPYKKMSKHTRPNI